MKRLSFGRSVAYSVSGLVAVTFVVPFMVIVGSSLSSKALLQFPPTGLSGRWYRSYLSDPDWQASTLHSLEVAAAACLLATALGTLAALALNRGKGWVRQVLTVFLLSPLIVPLIVIAVGTYSLFTSWHLAGTELGLIIAHSCLALPFVVINVLAALAGLDPSLESAARSLGCSPIEAFARVTLPLIKRGVLIGALFAFMTSWDEVVEAIFLTSSQFHTLPIQIWTDLQSQLDPTVSAVGTLITVFSIVTFGLLLLAQRTRSRGARRRANG